MKAKTKSRGGSWLKVLRQVFASRQFFYGVLAFLVLSSAYVALVSLYPMAFDEEVHVGLIRAYSELWSPFSLVQKPEYDTFGTVVTDPSYLFHYLMSFPYRVLDTFIASETAIIIILRFINIALFTAGIVVFRKLLLAVGVSRAVTHLVLAVVVLVPVVPLLAGQVNYDNLLMLVTALLVYYAWLAREALRTGKGNLTLLLAVTVMLMLYGSVVKYAFLPIILAVAAYLVFELALAVRRDGFGELFGRVGREIGGYSPLLQSVLIVGLFAGVFLFSQRYVLNIVQYGSPVPKCDAVVSVERCMAFGPFGRDHRSKQNSVSPEVRSLPHYAATHFAWGMWHRLYFTIAGPTNFHQNFRHLPIMSYTAAGLVALAALAFVIFARPLLRDYPALWLFLLIPAVYIGVLLGSLYGGTYSQTGRPVAINGRYLIPILPLVGAVGATALVRLAYTLKAARYLGIGAVVVLLLLLQGGGPLSYITQARPAWFWNDTAAGVNETLAKPLRPLIIDTK